MMMEACILCGHGDTAPAVLSRELRDEHSGRFSVVRCGTCGHVQVAPLPSREEEAAYYAKDMQPRHLWTDGDYFDIVRAKARPETERRLAWLHATTAEGGAVLDIGSGYGFFVDAVCAAGFAASGLEVSNHRLQLARSGMRGTFIQGEANETFVAEHTQRYDTVTAFHVIEHVRDPVAYLRQLMRLLRPGGTLLVEVPNVGDELIAQIPEYARHHWQICHLSYFDKPRLELALRRAGAERCEVRGVQRYGLRHLLSWTDTHAPDLSRPQPEGATPLLSEMEAVYRTHRERSLTCDTLVAEVRVGAR